MKSERKWKLTPLSARVPEQMDINFKFWIVNKNAFVLHAGGEMQRSL